MNTNTQTFFQELTDTTGATALEYGLLATLVVMTAIGAFSATGTSLTDLYKVWTAAVIAAL